MEEIWRRDGNSEDELDIRFKNSGDEMENNESRQVPQASGMVATNQTVLLNSDSDNSENIPLAKNQKNVTPTRKIHPSEIHLTLGEKITKYIKTRKNVAIISLRRKAKEP